MERLSPTELAELAQLMIAKLSKEYEEQHLCPACGTYTLDDKRIFFGDIEMLVDYMVAEMFNQPTLAYDRWVTGGCMKCYEFTLTMEDIVRPLMFDHYLRGKNIGVAKNI